MCYCFGQCLQAAWFWFIILLCDSFVTIEGSQIIAFLAHHILALPLRLYAPHLCPGYHTLHLLLLSLIVFIQCYSRLTSRFSALMLHVILNHCILFFFFFIYIFLLLITSSSTPITTLMLNNNKTITIYFINLKGKLKLSFDSTTKNLSQ